MDRRLNLLGLTGYVFIGTAAVLIPSIMPQVNAEFTALGFTLAAIGLIFPARAAGGILGNLLAGVGSDRLGRRRLVWISALVLAISLTLTALAQAWTLFLIGFVVISAAQGSLSTGINAMIADANPNARGRALNILHAVYGAGAAVSPLVIGYFLDRGVDWRWALGGAAAIWLAYALGAWQLGGSDPARATENAPKPISYSMLRAAPLAALFAVAFIYNGVATSLLGWIALYMQESAGLTPFLAVSMISVFYAALTIGRFLCAAFAERLGYAATLLILGSGITLTYPLVLLGGNPLLVTIGVFLTGLSFSGLFPTALAYGSRLYPQQTGSVAGLLSVSMTLGAMIPPWWTGLLAAWWGLTGALAFNYLLVPPLIFLALFLGRRERQAATPALAAE